MEKKTNERATRSAEFMLKEYDRISTLWMDEIRQSEQRVNFFLTIASAITGAIIILSQASAVSKEIFFVISVSALVILLLYGITFLNRLIARGVQSRAFHSSLTEINNYFARRDPEISDYLEIQKKIYQPPIYRFKFMSIIFKRFRGEITDLVILSDGLICSGIMLLALSHSGSMSNGDIMIWTILTALGSIGIFYIYVLFVRKYLPAWKIY